MIPTLTVTGGEHASYVEAVCDHGTTGIPVPDDDALTAILDRIPEEHAAATGCDCREWRAVLDSSGQTH